jgi:AI-2 transport protein TqsA
MSDSRGNVDRLSDRVVTSMLGLCTLIITIAALYFARSVFAPLAFAVFIIALIWPVQRRLQSRMPKLVALAVSVLVTILIFTAFGSMITWSFTRVGRYVVGDSARFQSHYAQLANWLEGHGIVLAGVWAEHFNVGWLLRVFQQITTRLNSTLSFSIIVLIYVILGLLEVEDAARRLRALRNAQLGQVLLLGGANTAVKFRRYMLVRTLMSVMTGLLVWAFASVAGLQLAAEWGVIAFALNYIPFIGPFVATVFPTLFAIAQFESWQMAVLVFGGLNLIQFLVGSYLEPRIAGNAVSLSPFLVLFAVFFWAFLWGIAGAFIGVPIVIAVMTICEQHPPSRWVADLFGAETVKQA